MDAKKVQARKQIEDYFRKVALEENQKNKTIDFSELLDRDDQGRRLLYVMPESIGDIYISTSLFRSLKEQYPNYNLYVAVKENYFDILTANPYIHKVIPYLLQMDNQVWLEGTGDHKGYFEIALLPYALTQRFLNYLNNGKSVVAYEDFKY